MLRRKQPAPGVSDGIQRTDEPAHLRCDDLIVLNGGARQQHETKTRQRRARLGLATVAASMVAVLFGLAASHAYLVSGQDRLDRFTAIKAQLDPDGMLTSDLWRRITARP